MQTYLIIGASTGIGKALSKQLADNGKKVYGTYLNNEIEPHENISTHQIDIREDVDLNFLPDSIDGIVYCPGSINLKPFGRLKPEQFMEDFNLQVVGAIRVIQAALDKLKIGENPSILLFSTVAVQQGYKFHSQVASSKGAIEGLTRSLAAEFAPNIRVNAIAPSLTDTPLAQKLLNSEAKIQANADRHPLKRIGSPSDISELANFLLSDKASWITGQIFSVDGGMSTLKI